MADFGLFGALGLLRLGIELLFLLVLVEDVNQEPLDSDVVSDESLDGTEVSFR